MQINILKIGEDIYLSIDGAQKKLEFDTIDNLIDEFVELKKEDFSIECEDESLVNYKSLIETLFNETKKQDFVNAYKALKKDELTNDDIIAAINAETTLQ